MRLAGGKAIVHQALSHSQNFKEYTSKSDICTTALIALFLGYEIQMIYTYSKNLKHCALKIQWSLCPEI